VDIKAAQAQGQLTLVDADELLPRFMGEKMPDAPVFLGLAGEVVARARGSNRYPKVRWWGEMVNVLWERGNATASMALEELFDQLAHEQEIAIFCSFRSTSSYRWVLRAVGGDPRYHGTQSRRGSPAALGRNRRIIG
jgi:alkyl sulfatase BDS1-like metallo-beta-lactamase superfamily hydrolase